MQPHYDPLSNSEMRLSIVEREAELSIEQNAGVLESELDAEKRQDRLEAHMANCNACLQSAFGNCAEANRILIGS